jgi:hypothetical protein
MFPLTFNSLCMHKFQVVQIFFPQLLKPVPTKFSVRKIINLLIIFC